ARRADALAGIAESYLNGEPGKPGENATADRYQVVLHVTAETLDSVQTASRDGAAACHLDDGPQVTAATARRIACDASIVRLHEDEGGEPLSIGRKSRTVPAAIRRALRARDDGCRFPGCTHRSFLDAHHIEHWADGGETGLDNLVQLCRHHHRLVHEGGFQCGKDADGELRFRDPRERRLNRYVVPTPVPDDAAIEDWMVSHRQDLAIDADTCVPNWLAGDRMDWDLAVGNLFRA
ncbi:MAG TPA: HNH endonuclease signature motif containing protein, partial [Steroidobacteraceae bacterium]|nr:HNH endonuclease signature motif containing protein [Steroidobacteraceae bacterium]